MRCIHFVFFHVYADTAHMDWLPPAKCVNPKFSSNGISIVANMCGMAECVNTKMGRTPTDSGGLRLVIMHNHKNEEERKIRKRKLVVKHPNTRKSATFNITSPKIGPKRCASCAHLKN